MKSRLKRILDKLWRINDDFDYEVVLSRTANPFEFEVPDFQDAAVNDAYAEDNKKWTHHEFIKKCKRKVIVEPDYSNCIADFNKILLSSVFTGEMAPSFPRYIRSFFKRKKKLDRAILFDGRLGINYFYFFIEVINKMWLLDKIDGYREIPIIIGERVFNKKYFQYIYQNTDLKNYNWFVQRTGDYLEVEELYLLRPMQFERKYFEYLKALLQKPERKSISRNVFLNRSLKTGRHIENFNEIKPVLEKFGFEIIDTENKELDYQIDLFGSTKYLISLHGAGNTNIIFADKGLKFLEINPGNRISCQFYWLAKTLNIASYNVILGGPLSSDRGRVEKGFYLDPQKLEDAILKMLD